MEQEPGDAGQVEPVPSWLDLADRLSHKRKRFVLAFLGEAGGNATEAARLAKYAQPQSQGPRLLKNVEVRAVIEAFEDDAVMSTREALARVSGWARGSFLPFLNPEGQLDLATDRARAAVPLLKKMKEKRTVLETTSFTEDVVDEETGELVEREIRVQTVRIETEVELVDPLRSAELILKANGKLRESSTVMQFNAHECSDEQLERIKNGEDPAFVFATSEKKEPSAD